MKYTFTSTNIYSRQNSLWQIERNQIGKRHRHEFPAHNCGIKCATAIHRTFYPQDDQTICFGKKDCMCYGCMLDFPSWTLFLCTEARFSFCFHSIDEIPSVSILVGFAVLARIYVPCMRYNLY